MDVTNETAGQIQGKQRPKLALSRIPRVHLSLSDSDSTRVAESGFTFLGENS
jgi:hypothetical protein